jgi:hypothetical protein
MLRKGAIAMKISSRHLSAALVLGAFAAALAGCAPNAAVDAPTTAPAVSAASLPAATAEGSVRLTIRLTPGGAELLNRVETQELVQRRDPNRNEPTFFRVYDGEGRVLAERGFRLETELRAEVPAADGTLSGSHVPIDAPIVSMQVPLFAETAIIRLYRKDAKAPDAAPALLAEVRP